MSEYGISRAESVTFVPQRAVLPIVDEEDSTTVEDKGVTANAEEKGPKNGSSDTGCKAGSEASYKGKRDPFANDGGGGMEYKTMAWWYVMI